MINNTRVIFIISRSLHYKKGFFEKLARRINVKFFFDAGEKKTHNVELHDTLGDYHYTYLKNIKIFNQIIIIDLLGLISSIRNTDVIIKADHNQINTILIFLLGKLLRKKIILWCSLWRDQKTFHSHLKYHIQNWYFNNADALICYGEHVKNYILHKFGVNSKKVFVEHHSTDINIYLDKEIDLPAFSKNDKVKILFVGRLTEQKGLIILLHAFRSLINYADLHIVGNGPLNERANKECAELGIMDSVFFHGFYEPGLIDNFYKRADILVLPSISTGEITEPWGYVVNEAMLFGLPVIVSSAVGAAAGGLVKHDINGLIVPENSAVELEKAMYSLVNNKEKMIRMGIEGKKTIRRWTHDIMTNDFVDVINFVLKKR